MPANIHKSCFTKLTQKYIITNVIIFIGVSIMNTLKITQIGNSLGVILPKEFLAKMKLGKGDELFVTENPNGLNLTPHNLEFEAQMEVARKIMKDNRAVLRELAK